VKTQRWLHPIVGKKLATVNESGVLAESKKRWAQLEGNESVSLKRGDE
jgi:hypothetical protein